MLSQLHIADFALIKEQTISFGSGLNVLSGESGTGKSLVLQALQFLLGAKARTQVIRAGADEAVVEGLFGLQGLPAALRAELPDIARGDELTLSRSVNASGKSKVYINGRLAALALLEELAGKLVSICGQSQHVRLLDARYHLQLLDDYAQNSDLLCAHQRQFAAWRARQAEFERLQMESERILRRQDELKTTVEELSACGLRAGLRQELEEKVKRLSQAEKILSLSQQMAEDLGDEGGLHSLLQRLNLQLGELIKLDPQLQGLSQVFLSARRELFGFEEELKRYASQVELDGRGLDELREQLAEIARLERKYRCDSHGLLGLLEKTRQELNSLRDAQGLEKLKLETERALAETEKLAGELSARRQAAAKQLAKAVEQGLGDLHMNDCRFSAAFAQAELGLQGKDKVELLMSSIRAEPLKPLRLIASGGELSRIMLVLKEALREQSGVNVLVFDEVDSGVSGGIARAVGEKLAALSKYSQVICITHLPQIASLADHHFLAGKEGRECAESIIREIRGQEKIEEIARMLAGYDITEASRESAKELISSKREGAEERY